MSIVIQGVYKQAGQADQYIPLAVDEDGVMSSGGMVKQVVPDARTAADLLTTYSNFDEVNWVAGDFVTLTKGTNGQQVTALSANPLTPGESRVWLNTPIYQPAALEVEVSIVRNRQQFGTITLFSNGVDNVPSPVPSPVNVVSISQSNADNGAAYSAVAGTICTVTLESALPAYPDISEVYLSDWIHITGLVDSRLNYQNAAIKFISADRKTITFGFADEVVLPSLAVPVITPTLGDVKVNFYNNMGGAAEGFGIRFTGTTVTSAAVVSLFGNGDAQVSGTLFGDHRIAMASTAPVYSNGVMGNVDLKASSRYRLEGRPSDCSVLDKGIDSPTTSWTTRVSRTAVKPSIHLPLYPRFRIYQPIGMSRPVSKVDNIVKAGSTTWTVTTIGNHNLVTGNYVTIKGNRDQVNFVSLTTPVPITVTGVNTFTLIGTTGTATGYGGSVVLVNGGQDQPGIIGQAVVSVNQYTQNSDWLFITGSSNWVGLNVGDYIHLCGVVQDLVATDLGLDGAWEVASIATTTLILKPIIDVRGIRVSPVMPAIGTTAVNAGGSVILRTTARVHDMMLEEWSESKVMIDGAGTTRVDKALPVSVLGTVPVSGTVAVASTIANQGTSAAISTTDGSGGWIIRPSIVGLTDIVSAAITSTATSASIVNDKGNGFQVTFPVTAVSGTNPTLDIRIEESYDGGVSWFTLYEMQRITATGFYNTPILRASGRHIRYVRTISGTSPSFTMGVVRNLLPFIQAAPHKRLIDRSIVLTTLNSTTPVLFSGEANNVQLVINIGAATTPPAIQVEGSEDGVNWYVIGTPLAAVASSTVEVTISKSPTFVRAMVSTAGVSVTAGYVSLKTWS